MRFWRVSSPGDRSTLMAYTGPQRDSAAAESERTDGVLLARQNVVREVGLFQGRLGGARRFGSETRRHPALGFEPPSYGEYCGRPAGRYTRITTPFGVTR